MTNHHENCPRYNDSLMDVWKVSINGSNLYVASEQEARENAAAETDGDEATVTQQKMHREIFDNLPEFDGF